jgi:hypothetical protein
MISAYFQQRRTDDLRNGQARENTTSQNKCNCDAQVQNQAGILLGELFLGKCMRNAAEGQGNGLDHGHKSVEDVDEEHVDATDAGRRDAIGARASGAAEGGGHSCVRHLSAGR